MCNINTSKSHCFLLYLKITTKLLLFYNPPLPTHTLMASIAYSTWNKRPSGENVFTPRSYSERVKNMVKFTNCKKKKHW